MGKSHASRLLLRHFDTLFGGLFNKLTIFHSPNQSGDYNDLISKLPANVDVVKRSELRAEFLDPTKLRSPTSGGTVVLFDDHLQVHSVFSLYSSLSHCVL